MIPLPLSSEVIDVPKGSARNAPCPCGSGKKFKKCCLSSTEDRAFESMPAHAHRRLDEESDARHPTCIDCLLVERLFTQGDAIPRSVIDFFVKRGEGMVQHLAKVVNDADDWIEEEPGYWATVHATNILGAIGTRSAVRPLLAALRFASEYDDEEITDVLPAIFGSIGPVALPDLVDHAEDRSSGWFVRSVCFDAIAAVVQKHPTEDSVLDVLAKRMHDVTEDPDVRSLAGCALLACTPIRYREDLLHFARRQASDDVFEDCMFDENSVRLAYAGMERTHTRLRRDWLDFYDDGAIAARRTYRERIERHRRWPWKLWRWISYPVQEYIERRHMHRAVAAYCKERERKIALLNINLTT